MAVSYPTLDTQQLDNGTWIAYCDGFEGVGATESEAIDACMLNLKNYIKGIK